ncbi:MAG TPA: transposase [Phototrophicaceae bacterium]|nr:transposase [Phototrophicaceae bacterium]
MATQVLIIHGQLPFAIKLKQTLERAAFEAHPFTSVEAAVDYLKDHVQDVALVDFAIPDFPGAQIVEQFRRIQPSLPIVATPKQDAGLISALDLIASLDAGFNARDLISLVNNYFTGRERPSFQPAATTALLSRLDPAHPAPPNNPNNPNNPPEHSSLDNVIASAGRSNIFESPVVEGDTPPSVDLAAWTEEPPPKHDAAFDEVLNALPTDSGDQAAPRSPFTDLVDSMRSDQTHQPLPSRQQQFVEFILTGGMDSLLEQMEQNDEAGSDTPNQAVSPDRLFQKLAAEEPPPPTFEESGTVSDLVVGVQDKSFRNVLSILRGEEEISEDSGPSKEVASFNPADFEPPKRPESTIPRIARDEFVFDDEPTPAKVILQRTLEQTMSGGSFSLEELLANIEAQLPLHRPKVQPLPSWLREQQSRSQDDAFLVNEPDFLPENLPEEVPPEPSEDYRDQTTQQGRGQQIEAHPEALETDWMERPPRVGDQTIPFPESLPEEIPAEPTVAHSYSEPEVSEETPARPKIKPLGTKRAEPEPEPEAPESVMSLLEEFGFGDETGVSEATPVPQETVVHAQPPTIPEEASIADEWLSAEEVSAAEEAPVSEATLAPQETTGMWYNLPEQDFNTQFEMMAAFEVRNESGVASGALYKESPVEPVPVEPPTPAEAVAEPVQDPYLAQLALSLTEVSLETTAEATLLALHQQIVAYAGQMPREEIEELRGMIADDWDAAPDEARIRFITSPSSGKDYMLYSRRTEDDLTLSLIFAGATPLRDIRRQGKRLVDALLTVPEAPPKTIPELPPIEPVDDVVRAPYAYVWVLRDAKAHLDEAASQAIIAGLNIQMREKQWDIQALQVHEDYVYLLADVPGEDPAYKIIRELKRRSAEIAHAQNPTFVSDGLWADSYLVVTPGRELDTEEIQQFINFERME